RCPANEKTSFFLCALCVLSESSNGRLKYLFWVAGSTRVCNYAAYTTYDNSLSWIPAFAGMTEKGNYLL
ncbi:hypothetical protein, partial [Desulfonatronovibrio magnus]|uniref:hypothetical protein n=1 Tax=Desulfonatronovibrio magnus TaxID=698827 RepID=UPI001E4A222D